MAGSSSKDAKRSKNEFPNTLAGFGYHFNKDGAMCNIKTGSNFQFVVKEGNQSYNQKHYEALGEIVTNHIYGLLESDCGLKKVSVPKNASDKEHSFMFMSDDALSNPDKLLVLIHGSGVVRAGQWARRLIINENLNSGTQIPFIHRAIKEGYGVIVMNTNDNVRKTDNGDIRLKGSESPEVHGSNVWVDYIQQSAAKHIAIIAHSFGGVVTTSLFAKFKADFKNRVFAVAMTDSVHYISHPNAYRLLIKLSRNWAASSKPLDTHLETRDGDITRVSAGVGVHEQTSWSSYESIFKFFKEKLDQINCPSDQEGQDEKEQTENHSENKCNEIGDKVQSSEMEDMEDMEEPQTDQENNENGSKNIEDTKPLEEEKESKEHNDCHNTENDENKPS